MKGEIKLKRKKECIAMLLAGGQGNRLEILTENDAKPSVIFGGKYRIIDFTLSNCSNSGIDTIGILTQYQPLTLNEYIGNGQPWDLDRTFGGVQILPPYKSKNSDWYKGTANAVYQNFNFIEKYNPDHVLILSGDHIYKMNYAKMLDFHKKSGAVCTIATKKVNKTEAVRFGILTEDENGRVTDFEEKPENPKSLLASMGIYIFSTDTLKKYLTADENDENSENDFGKNVIPALIKNHEEVFTYHFDGYWKDVGTLNSLWEANMDILGESPVFSTSDKNWKIYSRNYAEPPQYIGGNASITNSVITEGCIIEGTVENSILSSGVIVSKGATVSNSVVFDHATIQEGAKVDRSIIDSNSIISCGAIIGRKDYSAPITVVGKGVQIPCGEKYFKE